MTLLIRLAFIQIYKRKKRKYFNVTYIFLLVVQDFIILLLNVCQKGFYNLLKSRKKKKCLYRKYCQEDIFFYSSREWNISFIWCKEINITKTWAVQKKKSQLLNTRSEVQFLPLANFVEMNDYSKWLEYIFN